MTGVGSSSSSSDRKEANRLRRKLGMQEIKTGNLRCLKCNKRFKSKDTCNNKMCDSCRNQFTE